MGARGVDSGGWNARGLIVLAAGVALVVAIQYTTDYGLLGTVAGVGGLLFSYIGLRSTWQAIASRSVEQPDIGDLAGRTAAVQIEGDAEPVDEPIEAPLSGTDSVGYQLYVSRWRRERTDSS